MKTRKAKSKPPKNMSVEKWLSALDDHPEWARWCPWKKLDWAEWSLMMEDHPEFAHLWPDEVVGEMDGWKWARVLSVRPELAERCDFAKFDANCWTRLLSARPQFAGKCDFAVFDGWHWADLLSARPEFAEKCDFSKLDPLAWELLLIFRPQFADKCGWAALPRDSQAAILSRRPELFAHCTIRGMTLGRFDDVAGKWARKSVGLEVGLAAMPVGDPEPELPVKRFLAWSRRNNLEGKALRDYAEWMRGPGAPDYLRHHADAAEPGAYSWFVVGIEGNRWRGHGGCEVKCNDKPADWNDEVEDDRWKDWETEHRAPKVPAEGGPLPGTEAWPPDGAARNGFPAVEFLRWAKRHDIVRRTFHGWTGLLRYILTESRDKDLARYVERKNWAGLHPYVTGAGVEEYGEAFCRLELANSRGRRVGYYEMLFKPNGHVSDDTYHMD